MLSRDSQFSKAPLRVLNDSMISSHPKPMAAKVVMAQGHTFKVLDAFDALDEDDREAVPMSGWGHAAKLLAVCCAKLVAVCTPFGGGQG